MAAQHKKPRRGRSNRDFRSQRIKLQADNAAKSASADPVKKDKEQPAPTAKPVSSATSVKERKENAKPIANSPVSQKDPSLKRPNVIEGIKRPIEGFKRFVTRRPSIQEIVQETTSGGIVYRRNPATGLVEILLIKDAKNRWTIPKGHVEEGEEPLQTAEREIREETGLQEMRMSHWLGKVTFRYRRSRTLVLMTMHIYLVEGKGDTNKLNPEDWLSDIKWMPSQAAIESIAYEDISKLILVGMKKVREGKA